MLLAEARSAATQPPHWATRSVEDGIRRYKSQQETWLSGGRVGSWKAVDAIYAHFGRSEEGDVTLEDLTFHSREDIAAIPGVGPKSMDRLDAELAERGLKWTDAAEAVTV